MISKKSLKAEIFTAYLESQNQIEILKKEIELLQNVQQSEILSIDDYRNDYVLRSQRHSREFKLFLDDLKFTAEFLKAKVQEVRQVELPAFLK
tara:strand:- start:72 stop:350 length:279 start_codon:yes stop_codon:yes gene_type:complete